MADEDELIQGLRSGKYTKEEVARRLPHRSATAQAGAESRGRLDEEVELVS